MSGNSVYCLYHTIVFEIDLERIEGRAKRLLVHRAVASRVRFAPTAKLERVEERGLFAHTVSRVAGSAATALCVEGSIKLSYVMPTLQVRAVHAGQRPQGPR